ncbi:hypothetical protein [Umezawaea sp. Da 62-37]|uniref:hypothetical protein n=1 Tax=Umezawaea sp. Da 62-37 TaxID=3075927 RepID=UPI0028F6D376|nr:hypothetical protein [Umezawaea sp. Da 62-37]WNV86626.1 hypothetical protein RM788_52365 [Umezawaea sp. Da 62-37]
MSGNLENRYRRLLRVLPRWYRAEREEEMVGLFLADRTDDLDLEHGWPGWGETGATLALGVRTRLAHKGAPDHAVVLGDVVRLVALIGLLIQVSYAFRWFGEALTSTTVGSPGIPGVPIAVNLLLVGGPLAMFTGQRTPAKVLAVLIALYGVLAVPLTGGPVAFLSLLWQLPIWVTAGALVAGFHRDAPAPAGRPWLWACVPAAAVAAGFGALTSDSAVFVFLSATAGELVPVVVIAAAVVHLLRRGPVARTFALAVWALLLLPVELWYLTLYLSYPGDTALAVFLAARTTLLVVVAVVLAAVGLRELRRPAAVTP